MAAQMQGHGGVRCGLWSRIASLTLVLATHKLCTLPRNCSVPHVRSIYVIGLLRGTMTTHRKCLVQSSLYKVYATVQAQPHLRNHSNLPIKPWVVKTSLPRDLKTLVCVRSDRSGGHTGSASKWHPHRPHGLVWACLPHQCKHIHPRRAPVLAALTAAATRPRLFSLHPSCDWYSGWNFCLTLWRGRNAFPTWRGRNAFSTRGNTVVFSLGKTLILVNPLNAKAYIC